jgi:hypothetical protein
LNDLEWHFYFLFGLKESNKRIYDITIGVTTFKDRYNSCAKPLIKRLALLFPENQILIAANGHYLLTEQKKYLKEISQYFENYNNLKYISFLKHKSKSFVGSYYNEFGNF